MRLMNLVDADLSYQPTGAERRGLVRLNKKLLHAWKGVSPIAKTVSKAAPKKKVAAKPKGPISKAVKRK